MILSPLHDLSPLTPFTLYGVCIVLLYITYDNWCRNLQAVNIISIHIF